MTGELANTSPQSAGPPGSKQPTLMEVRNLHKRFRGSGLRGGYVEALRNVSFDVARGEVVALVGESGSGKTTTARVIARLIRPSGGEVRLDGADALEVGRGARGRRARRDVQIVFQDPFSSLNPTKTVAHHLVRPLKVHHRALDGAGRTQRMFELLDSVGLPPTEEFLRKLPHELSGGQRQRVAFARALAVDPRVLLADEPVSMLDVSIRTGILNLIKRLGTDRGIGILFITHDLSSARYVADRIVVMHAGYGVEGGPAREVFERPAHPYTRLLLASEPGRRVGGIDAPARSDAGPARKDGTRHGCPFAPRCGAATEECTRAVPEIVSLGRDRWVRCNLPERGDAG